MRQDSLLESFKRFELSNEEISTIHGGETVVGCREYAGKCYADIRMANGEIRCDVFVDYCDSPGWCPIQ